MTFKFNFPWMGGVGGTLNCAIAAALVLSACGGAVVEPNANDARWAATRWPGTSVSTLQGGRSVFVSRCSSCHALPEPNVKTPDEWASVIDEMAPRAHLTPDDRDAVLRYLSAASERLRKGG
jgi:mono/diheme cytochrome c family protein